VTTSNAGAAELIEAGSTGFIVPPADSEALAERIEWCLSHPRELLEMRPQALASVRDRTWQRFRAELRDQLSAALQIHTTEVAA
jgi:glycosyltransferase involved in cell wall biosynthesis